MCKLRKPWLIKIMTRRKNSVLCSRARAAWSWPSDNCTIQTHADADPRWRQTSSGRAARDTSETQSRAIWTKNRNRKKQKRVHSTRENVKKMWTDTATARREGMPKKKPLVSTTAHCSPCDNKHKRQRG